MSVQFNAFYGLNIHLRGIMEDRCFCIPLLEMVRIGSTTLCNIREM